MNTVFPELDGPETIIEQGCLNRVSNSISIVEMINNAATKLIKSLYYYLQLQTRGDKVIIQIWSISTLQ